MPNNPRETKIVTCNKSTLITNEMSIMLLLAKSYNYKTTYNTKVATMNAHPAVTVESSMNFGTAATV